jgi:hypothetical protein
LGRRRWRLCHAAGSGGLRAHRSPRASDAERETQTRLAKRGTRPSRYGHSTVTNCTELISRCGRCNLAWVNCPEIFPAGWKIFSRSTNRTDSLLVQALIRSYQLCLCIRKTNQKHTNFQRTGRRGCGMLKLDA